MVGVVELPEDRIARKFREWHRSSVECFDTSLKEMTQMADTVCVSWNSHCLVDLERDEGAQRLMVEDEHQEVYRRIFGIILMIKEKEKTKFLQQERVQHRCNAIYGRREHRDCEVEQAVVDQDLEEGRRAMREERERATRDRKEREQRIRKRQTEEDSLRRALAFVAGQETRGRQELDQEEQTAWEEVLETEKKAIDNLDSEIVARWLASEEGRRQYEAEQERLNEDRKAKAKKELEFKKEQNRLSRKCTHSRNGTSVFVGPFPKKVCLICKIKYDAATGIYTSMK